MPNLNAINKKNDAIPLLTILGIGIALSFLLFLVSRELELQQIQAGFLRQSDVRIDALERELEVNTQVLLGLRDLFSLDPGLDRSTFSRLARPHLEQHKGIQALEWIPRVSAGRTEWFEQKAREDGLAQFRIHAKRGKPTTPPHYPVYYLEPLIGNEQALGFDLGSEPSRRDTIELAIASALPTASPPVSLVQERGSERGVLLFTPVYRDGETSYDGLIGLTLAVYRLQTLVHSALRIPDSESLPDSRLVIRDADSVVEEPLLELGPAGSSDFLDALANRRSLSFGQRSWQIIETPSRNFIEQSRSRQPYLLLLGSLLLTGFIALFARTRLRQSRLLAELVELRNLQLQESQSRNTVILDTAVESIITIDHQGRILQFNHGAEKMFGYQSDELQGKNVNILMPEPYHSEHDGYLQRYLAERKPHIIGIGREIRARRKDGSEFPADLSVGETRIDGNTLFVGVITDITERKLAQQALTRAKEEAEHSSRMKSEFVNMMSHELRTPLTVILGYLPLLKNPDRLPNMEMISSIATDIETSGEHLLCLINDLLDISKIEAGKLNLHKELIELPEFLSEVAQSIAGQLQAAGLKIELHCAVTQLEADPLRLKQILLNLLGNAIKFTPRGGIVLSAKQTDDKIEIRVSDTGIGISEEDLPHIFDKFHQVDSSSTRLSSGTGLGLAITRRLVELHGGTIEVSSQVGVGTSFVIQWPVTGGNTEADTGEK